MNENKDFVRTAKILLNLVENHLKSGERTQAEDAIRALLIQASEIGRDRTVKLSEAINQQCSVCGGSLWRETPSGLIPCDICQEHC